MNAKIIVSELSRLDRVGLERHLLSLGEEDRRLRFGLALFMQCLTDNAAMMHLARTRGMAIVTEAGAAGATLKLPAADALSGFGAAFDQRFALFDYALKAQLKNARRLAGAFC